MIVSIGIIYKNYETFFFFPNRNIILPFIQICLDFDPFSNLRCAHQWELCRHRPWESSPPSYQYIPCHRVSSTGSNLNGTSYFLHYFPGVLRNNWQVSDHHQSQRCKRSLKKVLISFLGPSFSKCMVLGHELRQNLLVVKPIKAPGGRPAMALAVTLLNGVKFFSSPQARRSTERETMSYTLVLNHQGASRIWINVHQ